MDIREVEGCSLESPEMKRDRKLHDVWKLASVLFAQVSEVRYAVYPDGTTEPENTPIMRLCNDLGEYLVACKSGEKLF